MSVPIIFLVFLFISAGNVWFSWKPLHEPHSHGFYRFFAFETALLLVLMNISVWFVDPLSPRQIISWILLIISIFMVVHAVYLLHQTGKPEGNFENTTVLVLRGAYHFIRHPMYSSLVYFVWGVFLKRPSIPGACLCLVTMVFLYAAARVEEAENILHFGDAYKEYTKKTKMFIPYIF